MKYDPQKPVHRHMVINDDSFFVEFLSHMEVADVGDAIEVMPGVLAVSFTFETTLRASGQTEEQP